MLDELITPGVIRKLYAWENDLLTAHFLRLDPAARHCRFAAGVSDETVMAYAGRALGPDAVVHGFLVEGVMRGAAELRLMPGRTGEVAVTVEDAWRLSGIGSALFGRLLLTARNRGLTGLVMTCLSSNRGMQRLAARFDGTITTASGDSCATVKARPATPLSLWREVVADSAAATASVIDRQIGLLRDGAAAARRPLARG